MKKRIIITCLFLVTLWRFSGFSQPGDAGEYIRGTWITNVASEVLKSKDNIVKAVRQCKENGLNTVFVVVWNNGCTMYPSRVTEKYVGIIQDPVFAGRDPIKEIIEEAHKEGIKVHAWFEFGFSYSYKDSNSVWLKKYPHWAGRNNRGELLQKNGFYWWNSLYPEVQTFMKELVTEVVMNYEIDGVQGDDRLPAMPAEGGYDDYSLKLYRQQFMGTDPTDNYSDPSLIQWKAEQLSNFGRSLYEEVKRVKPSCIVSWAPSIYPWSKEQYLQDWPSWLKDGYADYIIPQLYRYNAAAYEKLLKELEALIPSSLKNKVFPGMLTSLGNGYESSREFTDQMLQLNRKYGFNGEVFFYFETLNRLSGSIYQNVK